MMKVESVTPGRVGARGVAPGLAVFALALVAVLMAGCSRQAAAPGSGAMGSGPASAPVAAAAPEPVDRIEWYAGSVESAFEKAKADNKPVFLYWGAGWCPPCHELQASVFSRPDFAEKLKLFIPVHLDGDDPGAQKWGDAFGVSGYPTVLVLKADRTELARISGGLDLSQYAEVLDVVLGDVRPISAVLASVRQGATTKDDCHRLAYYEWSATDEVKTQAGALAEALVRAGEGCGEDGGADRIRLNVMAADLAARAQADALKAGAAPDALLAQQVRRLDELLQDPAFSLKAADVLGGLPESFFEAVVKVQPDRAQAWRGRYATTMESAAQDARFSVADHLYMLYAKLRAERALDPQRRLSPDVVGDVQKRIEATLARPLDEHTRSSAVNAALNIEDLLGDDDRAYAIVQSQMARSKSPWYYMLDLADLDEKHGKVDSAVGWLAKAYAQAEGPATRFQWGTEYVLGLVRMKPADDARIREAGLSVLGELDGPDRIYRRTRVRLEKLDQALAGWNHGGAHAQAVAALRTRMQGICDRLPAGDPARGACTGFLSTPVS